MISADGSDIKPVEVDFIIASIAERYDFYIRANQPLDKSSYWIRAETLEVRVHDLSSRYLKVLNVILNYQVLMKRYSLV